jgi:hypothetical protein
MKILFFTLLALFVVFLVARITGWWALNYWLVFTPLIGAIVVLVIAGVTNTLPQGEDD